MFLCGRVGKLGKRLRNRHLQDLQPCPCLREPPPERLWLVRSPPVHLLLHGGWKSGCRPQVIEMMTHIEHVYPHVLKVEASSDWCLFALAKFPVPRLTSSCHVSSPADHKCKQGRSQHNSDSKNRSLPSLCSVWIGDYRNRMPGWCALSSWSSCVALIPGKMAWDDDCSRTAHAWPRGIEQKFTQSQASDNVRKPCTP